MLTKNTNRPPWGRMAVAAALLTITAHAHAWTVIVNDAGDTTGSCATTGAGACTLHDAFTYANANHAVGDDNRIEFNIAGGGEHTIALGSELLPALLAPAAPARSLTVDGSTQPGYAGHTPRRPLITVQGDKSSRGIAISGHTTVRGLAIVNFGFGGITIDGDANAILGCHVGVDAPGTQGMGNNYNIVVNTGAGNRIGSLDEGGRNIISAAANGPGIHFTFLKKSQNTVIQGNYIGTDISGNAALGNNTGIKLSAGHDDVTIDRNLVSANRLGGIATGGSGTIVTNNRVGTNASGMEILGAQEFGIQVYYSKGGGQEIRANLVSGHGRDGIGSDGDADTRNPGMQVVGNIVGLSADESKPLPNKGNGIGIKHTDGAIVRGNIVGGNQGTGIDLKGPGNNNKVQANLVGINSRGESMPNESGIGLWSTTSGELKHSLIGGESASDGNIIAHSPGFGIVLYSVTVQGTSILGNSIYSNARGGIAMSQDKNGNTANRGQVRPALSGITKNSVSGTLNAPASESFRIEYFSTPRLSDGSPAAYAAKTLLGVQTVSADAAGQALLQLDAAMPSGKLATVTAIATRLSTRDSSTISGPPLALGNQPPQATAQDLQAEQDKPLAIVLAASDPDGDALSFAIASPPQHGSLTGLDPATGAVTYQPAAGYVGPDSFSFIANDGEEDSAAATVNITVNQLPPPPPPPPPPSAAVVPVPGLRSISLLVLALALASLVRMGGSLHKRGAGKTD